MPCAGAAPVAREWGVLGAGRGDRGAWWRPWRPGNGECSALAVAIEGVVTVLGPGAGERSPRWGAAGVVLRAMLCSWRGSRPLGGVRAVLRAGRGFKGIPSLCKCYNACEVWYRCESGGIAVKAAPVL